MTATLYFPNFRNYLWAGLVGLVLGVLCLISPFLGLGAVVVIVAALLAFSRPILLCYLLIPAIILTVGMPRGKLVPLLLPSEAVLVLAGGVAFFVMLVNKRPLKPVPVRVVVALAIFVIGTSIIPLISYMWRGFELSTKDIFSLLSPVKFLLLFWLFSLLPDNDKDRERLIQWMLVWSSVMAFVGLLQSFKIGFIVNMLNQWYPSNHTAVASELGRVTSLLGAWNAVGTFLMLTLLLIIALFAIKHGTLYTLNMLIALALSGACLLASGSFAGAGGLGAAIVIIKFFDRRGLRALFLLFLGLVVAVFLLQSVISQRLAYQFRNSNQTGVVPETMSYRIEVWTKIYFPIVSKNLLTGVQPSLTNLTWQWAESQYIYLLFKSGILALIAHLVWVGMMLAWLYRKMRSSTGTMQVVAITAFALFIVLSVMGFTNEVFTFSGANEYLWIMLGLLARS